MGKVIGIDLGTTNSCVAVVENNEPVIIPSETGSRTTPSVVGFSKAGERLVGEIARRQAVTNPERTIASVKRHMGTEWTTRIDGELYKPQTISAMILAKLKKEAENFTGETIHDAVITVPAYFNDAQRQATKDAGRIAGLNVLRIINEPTSAALAYGLDHADPQKIMVYDLGGGTFDVSIIEISDGVIEVLSTCGDNHLGGDDFDQRITDWIVKEFQRENRIDLRRDFAAMQRVREAAEAAKKELSSTETASINLPYITMVGSTPLHVQLTLTRSVFTSLVSDLIERTEGPVRTALADAGISASQLGLVLLVGGSTRIPAVQQKVSALTGKEPSRNINPDECVAMGAAILGSTLAGNALMAKGTGQDLILFDVTPMSLSIETVGGVATPLINKNSTIPTRYTKTFYAASPMQKVVEIRVLQGDRPMARDNKMIGKFRLSGIKRSASGLPQIDVTFDIDANGILTVSAQDQMTGKFQSITITANDRMSDAEVEKARQEAQMYAQQDDMRRSALELYSQANALAARVTTVAADKNKIPDKSQRKLLQRSLKDLSHHLKRFNAAKITQEQINDLQEAKDRLEQEAAPYLDA
ncbi:MAG: molecular chaperone DnaK [Lachnospiraceae bacterium]|nr:molecular chaperone DnaK [Lachnospiraceae bacterium]